MMKKLFLTILFCFITSIAFAASKTFIAGGVDSNWSTAGNWSPVASVPAAGDDVILDSSSPNCVIDVATNALKSFDMNGYTATLSGTANLIVRSAANTTTLCRLKYGGGFTWSGTLALRPNATNGVITFTSDSANGVVLDSITQTVAGGTVNQGDAVVITNVLTITTGTWNTNGYTITCDAISSSSATNVRAINCTNSTINITGSGVGLTFAASDTLTFTGTGSTWNFTYVGATASSVNIAGTSGDGVTLPTVVVTGGGSGAWTFNCGGSTFGSFTITNAPTTIKFTAGKTLTISGNFSASGSSGNLITLSSSTAGTTSTVNIGGTITAAYWSIRDITNSGASAPFQLDNNSKGGTTDANVIGFWSKKTISDAGGNWGTASTWTEGVLPTSLDEVVATGTSGNLSVNTSNIYLQGFDLTNYVGTLSNSLDIYVYPVNSGTWTCKFAGTNSWTGSLQILPYVGTVNLTSGGKLSSANNINCRIGTISLQDNLTVTDILIFSGVFTTNNNIITASTMGSGASTSARTLNLGSSTITCSGLGNAWNFDSTDLTINASSSTIIISNATATSKTFKGGGETYGTVTFSGDNITIADSNTYNTFNVNNAGLANGLILTAGSTQTITNFTTNGYALNLAILKSSAASLATLTTGSAQISEDYMNLTWVQPTQADTWYAGANSTDGGNNGNWIFTAPPSPGVRRIMMIQ